MRTILFVCTGNTCRSPMAEAIARDLVRRGALGEGDDLFIASAGVSAVDGVPTTRETVDSLSRRGIAHQGRSVALTPEMILKADLVLCMTRSHAEAARSMVEGDLEAQVKISTLDPQKDIDDPIGMGQDTYDRLADELAHLIPERLEELLQP